MAGLNVNMDLDAQLGPPPPYCEVDASQGRRQHETPISRIHRKPVANSLETNHPQRIRYQRSNQELGTASQRNPSPNLRHQRSFQESHVALDWDNQPPPLPPRPSQNVQAHSAVDSSQRYLNHNPFQGSSLPPQRTYQPHDRHRQPYQNLQIPSPITHSPRLQHQRSFQEIPSSPGPNTQRLRNQRSYQDIRGLEPRTQADMQHLRSFKGGRRGEDAEPEKQLKTEVVEVAPGQPSRPTLAIRTTTAPPYMQTKTYASSQSSGVMTPDSLGPTSSLTSLPSSVASSPRSEVPPSIAPAAPKSNVVQNAFREVRHFAGGLVSHPYETTKHFTILRHSHGLVFYQGTTTSLAMSIFADASLPPDRTFWLQSKGYSGNTGMRLKAFVGANSSWIDVTPSMPITAEQLNPSDERAWQRDIAKFRKKAKPVKIREKHQLRETVILRIPAEASDGYFSVVMCIGDKKKNLITSPTFRIMSTSTSMHSIRGASLATLPLELGAMAVNVYATSKIAAVAGPVTHVVQGRVQKYMPSTITTKVVEKATTKAAKVAGSKEKADAMIQKGKKAYEMAGGDEKVKAMIQNGNMQFEQQRLDSLAPANNMELTLEAGPQAPYPMSFTCTSEPLTANDTDRTSLPTTILTGAPDHICHQLHGHYFAWAKEKGTQEWTQALISVLPPDPSTLKRADLALANKRVIKLRLLESDYEDSDSESLPLPTKQNILILGFLRPDDPVQRSNIRQGLQAGDEAAEEACMITEMNDMTTAQAILDHPAWAPEVVVGDGKMSVSKGIAGARMGVQRGIEGVGLSRLGIRSESDKVRDKSVGTGGFYVLR